MKFFPLKTFLSLTTILVVFGFLGIGQVEQVLETRYTQDIENIYINDTQPLFDGSIRLADAISTNIDNYLQEKPFFLWGARTDVTVTAGGKTLLYPVTIDQDAALMAPQSRQEIAAENYRLMNQGLQVKVDLILEWNSFFVITIFLIQLVIFVVMFSSLYFRSTRKARREYMERQEELNRLYELEEHHSTRLRSLNTEKDQLAAEIDQARDNLEEYRQKASKNEDAMIDEIILLEEKVRQNLELMHQVEQENASLKEVTGEYEQRLQEGKKKTAAYGNIEKRFKTLYPNILMHKRALDNFLTLSPDLKIKAEVVIRQLDADTTAVDIKRKVELRKSREKIFEAMFAYSSRLYFRNTKSGKIEVLAIGAKNSQVKDLAFLENF